MVGPLIYSFPSAVAAAKVITDFAKGNDKLVVKAGRCAGKALDANGGGRPWPRSRHKDVLLAQLAGLLMSPIQRTAGVLAALAEKKGGGTRPLPEPVCRSPHAAA